MKRCAWTNDPSVPADQKAKRNRHEAPHRIAPLPEGFVPASGRCASPECVGGVTSVDAVSGECLACKTRAYAGGRR